MSAKELLDRFMALTTGDQIDWHEMRKEVLAEHEKASDERDRVLCLNLHRALMNFVERSAIEPQELEEFRKVRDHDYIGLLLREATIGETEDNLDPSKVLAVTTRDVRDGRMNENYELHRLALDTVRKLGELPATKHSGLSAKLRSWFK
jgi:hypothetical protein